MQDVSGKKRVLLVQKHFLALLFSTFSFDLSPFCNFGAKTSFLAFLVKFSWGQSGRLSVRGEGYTPQFRHCFRQKTFPLRIIEVCYVYSLP